MTDEIPGKSGSGARRASDRKLSPRGGPAAAMWYVLALFLLVALGQAFYFSMQGGEAISYSEFTQQVNAEAVKSLTSDWTYDVVSLGYPGPVVHDGEGDA